MILHVKSPTLRAAKLKVFTVLYRFLILLTNKQRNSQTTVKTLPQQLQVQLIYLVGDHFIPLHRSHPHSHPPHNYCPHTHYFVPIPTLFQHCSPCTHPIPLSVVPYHTRSALFPQHNSALIELNTFNINPAKSQKQTNVAYYTILYAIYQAENVRMQSQCYYISATVQFT